MHITRTPFRISFAGGGTDLPEFYRREFGAVISTAIDKYMYINVNKSFDHRIRIAYSKTEIVDSVDEIIHPVVREALKFVGITNGVEITSIADIPAGTGMGSSSSFTVGLLNALYRYLHIDKPPEDIAREAAIVEIDKAHQPIGKQDHYIAAVGGVKLFRFNPDENVEIHPVKIQSNTIDELNSNIILFYTGATRSANHILDDQIKNVTGNMDTLRRMRDLAYELKDVLESRKDFYHFGELLHQNWLLKQSLSPLINPPFIEQLYNLGLRAGASGGKILGAGGGGFLLFCCEKSKQDNLRKVIPLREFPVKFEKLGSQVIY